MPKRSPGPKFSKGATFGKLVVVGDAVYECRTRHRPVWWYPCQCSCGATLDVAADRIQKATQCNACAREAATAKLIPGGPTDTYNKAERTAKHLLSSLAPFI